MTGKISLALNILLAVAVIYLFTRIGEPAKNAVEQPLLVKQDSLLEKIYPSIVYVNNDSLQKNFELMNDINLELKKHSDDIAALESKFQKSQQERANVETTFSQNVQNGVYTSEAEAEAAYIKAGEKAAKLEDEIKRVQRNLENKYSKYQEKTISLNDSLLNEISKYIDSYSTEKSIDLILLYTQNQNGLYANDKLDITSEVVTGLNNQYLANKKGAK